MSRAPLLALSFVATAAFAACGDPASTEPAAVANTVVKTSTDTTKPPPSSFNLTGKALGVDAVAGQGSDTLHFTPVAGAQVLLVRNVLVNGQGAQVPAGETTTSATGAYQFSNLTGGYYIVTVNPPAGSPYQSSWSYVAGMSPNVDVNVFLWRSR